MVACFEPWEIPAPREPGLVQQNASSPLCGLFQQFWDNFLVLVFAGGIPAPDGHDVQRGEGEVAPTIAAEPLASTPYP